MRACHVPSIVIVISLLSTPSLAFGPIQRLNANSRTVHRARRPSFISMARDINIRIVGRKPNEKWLDDAYQMYDTRLQPSGLQVTTTWHKDDAALVKGIHSDQSKNHSVVFLDPTRGNVRMTSEEFATKLYQWLDAGGSRLTMVIGGAEGLPKELLDGRECQFLTLSSLTFTHQWARVILMEQIYRASEIKKGSGYHK